ncbi:MAG TPA: LacI family DNA-binding transcriptional regulator [Rectinemataceae bacterium]|nr:LacI family DNA-binding transcriptional regulator [Rectinemataceae bacterium]
MAIRIKDIAEMAGVSPATVSLVLNSKPGAGEGVRERVLRIAKEQGYVPLRSSSSAPAGETACFLHIARHGHTINRDHDVFIADYIEGLGQGAKQHGLGLEVLTYKSTPVELIVEAAQASQAEGIVILGTELSASDVEAFSAVRKPLVFLDTYHDFLPFDFVDMNNGDAAFTVVSYLKELGHRSIGLVKGEIETRNFRLREEGFVASLDRLGLDFDPGLVFSVDQTFHGAYEGMLALLKGGTSLPSALFCENDIIACGVLRALKEKGVRVPEDISLVGFDDLPLSSVVDPPLTTIQVSKAQIGRTAIQLLQTRIRSEADEPPSKVLIGGRLVVRQSTRAVPA